MFEKRSVRFFERIIDDVRLEEAPLGNRAIDLYQTADDVRDLLVRLNSSELGTFVCFPMGQQDSPAEMSFDAIDNGTRMLLTKPEFSDRVRRVEVTSGRTFISEMRSEGILVECSRVREMQIDRGRFWHRTLLLIREDGRLAEIPKSDEFVDWAVRLYRRIRSVSIRLEIRPGYLAWCLPQAHELLRSNAGEFDNIGVFHAKSRLDVTLAQR